MRLRGKLAVLAALTLTLMLMLSMAAVAAAEEPSAWTVLFYLCGSDLESKYSYASGNLKEIASCREFSPLQDKDMINRYIETGFENPENNGKVNVLIATGGAMRWHTGSMGMNVRPDAIQYWRFEPDNDSAAAGGFHIEQTLPLCSMADPETLSDFIRWGAESYPAEKYMLVLWDHGGGSKTGIFIDELFQNDTMYLDELGKALEEGGVRFETVLFDACMMGNVETAYAIRNQAKWMVGSEELVAGKGTAMGDWLQQLYLIPQCDGEMLSRWICDFTMIKYTNEQDNQTLDLITWSVIDLSRIERVAELLDQMFQSLGKVLSDNPDLAASFAKCISSGHAFGTGEENMYDLASIMYTQTFRNTIPGELQHIMTEALMKAVPYSLRGDGRASARGLSICFAVDFFPEELDEYARNCPFPHYLAVLDAIGPWTAPDWVYEQVERLPGIDTIPAYQVRVRKELFTDGTPALALEEGCELNVDLVRYNLYWKNEESGQLECLGTSETFPDTYTTDHVLYRPYDLVHWPSINGQLCQIDLVSRNSDNYNSLNNIPIQINGRVWKLRCEYIGGKQAYEVYGLWEGYDSESKLFNRNVKSLAQFAGQEYQLLHEVRQESEEKNQIWARSEPQKMTRQLQVEEMEIPCGTYYIEFVVDDLFMRAMKMDMLEMTWDGKKLTVNTEGWEGTETLTADGYYAGK